MDDDLETSIQREAMACEMIRRHPHPNIAAYHGCVKTNGRVAGMAFQKLQMRLLEAANPQCLGKRAFVAGGQRPSPLLLSRPHVDGLLSAIHDIHSLNLVHDDINPANVMLDEDGFLFLVDFDSCRFIGESLIEIMARRTRSWHDPAVKTAAVENDLDAFSELVTWLTGSVSKLRFP